ncbi:DoxX-like family protein [Tumebacillus avium]|uniref:DoxX-like family protein n=1 Tax=Tumebacillus avium TaxID=1903704 RepID=A0A1Y0IL72_9BACL|nr:DoxX family protein [Tumebacillus avium]ARU60779.1 DoxX-like family protein [Tumebacillus avium]
MRNKKVLYWVFTGLLAALMLVGSIPDIMSVPEAVELFDHLGYPAYLLPFLGVAKTVGVIAILIPGFPRIKEWAYAGFVFDLAGAMYSSIAVGDPASGWLPFLFGFLLIAGSYVSYHSLRKAAPSQGLKNVMKEGVPR